MHRFVPAAVIAAILLLPSVAEAGCYRLGETGYHRYHSCWGPYWIYPHYRVCRHGYCWFY